MKKNSFLLKNIKRCAKLFLKCFGRLLNDKSYVSIQYFSVLGKFPNIKNPTLFTEKLQWLKLYDHNPLYTKIVDKYEVKEYISNIIGDEYVIPTLGVWNSPEEIEYNNLPDRFVLKTTFGGGSDGVIICRDKSKIAYSRIESKLNKSFNTNPYSRAREWPYKDVPHRIIAEKYLEDDSGELRDYKFFCFNGVPRVMLVATNRFTNHYFNYFDMDFNLLSITSFMGSQSNIHIKCPDNFDEMKLIAAKLSKGFPHVRVDLYNCQGKVYFGELTLYDSSGFDDFNSEEWNRKFGNWIILPDKKVDM